MDTILNILAKPDVCSLLGLILTLCWIGSVMISSRPDLHGWGYRLAGVSFVGYGLYAASVEEPRDADTFLFITIRALFAGGWMLGGSWIVLAVGGFVSDRLKRTFDRPQRRFPDPLPTEWPDPARLLALPSTQVIDVKSEPVKETLREKVSREKKELQERLDVIATELTDIGGDEQLAKDVIQELSARQLEKYLRRLGDELDRG